MPAGSEENSAEHLDKILDKPISAHPGLHFLWSRFFGVLPGLHLGHPGLHLGHPGLHFGSIFGPSGTVL